MNHSFKILVIVSLLISSTLCLTSCKKKPTLPVVTTTGVTAITQTTATTGGNVTSDGGAEVTARGICWGTTTGPTITSSKTSDSKGTGSFTSSITGLTPGITYYLRAYATNNEGTAYGNELSFPTLQITGAVVTIADVTSITSTTAASGGDVTSDGGGTITARGVCWATYTNPNIEASNKTNDGTGTGSFISNLTNLYRSTKYYLKAYATNSAGTAYSNEVTFTTDIALPKCTTSSVLFIAATTAISGFQIADDGGTSITANGICWSKNENPSLADSHTNDVVGTYGYQSIVSGIETTAGIVYYVRAYATNSVGTSYGEQVSFTTVGIIPKIFNSSLTYGSVTDIDGNIYKTIQIGTQIWMAENLKTTKYNDGSQIALKTDQKAWNDICSSGEAAYCWFNDENRNKDIYGAFYSWPVGETGKLCPIGWHVPSHAEWTTLATYLGGTDIAGGKLKETGTGYWTLPNQDATNETGFTGLGIYGRSYDLFGYNIGVYANWWSSTEDSQGFAYAVELYYSTGVLYINGDWLSCMGFPVRCIKDN